MTWNYSGYEIQRKLYLQKSYINTKTESVLDPWVTAGTCGKYHQRNFYTCGTCGNVALSLFTCFKSHWVGTGTPTNYLDKSGLKWCGSLSCRASDPVLLEHGQWDPFIYCPTGWGWVAFIAEEGHFSLRTVLGNRLVQLMPHQLQHIFPLARKMMKSINIHNIKIVLQPSHWTAAFYTVWDYCRRQR